MSEQAPLIGQPALSAVDRSPGGRWLAPAVQRDADPTGDVLSELLFPGEFDKSLRCTHPALGLRDIGEVVVQASRGSLRLSRRVAMPSNNPLLVFEADDAPRVLP